MFVFFARRLVAEFGASILKDVVKRISQESGKRFIKGVGTEIIGNIVAAELLNDTINYYDLVNDAILAGINDIVAPKSKWGQAAFDCIIGFDTETIISLINAKNSKEFTNASIQAGIQCIIPVVIGGIGNKLKDKILKKEAFAKYSYKFLKEKVKLGNEETSELMCQMIGFDELFKKRSKHYKDGIKKVLATKSGVEAVDVLIESGFDISKLSSKGLEKLANIIGKYGDDLIINRRKDLVELFRLTKDVNGMLVFLDNMVNSLSEYKKAIKSIQNNEKFSKIITVNGEKYNFSDFFNSYKEGYDYYHKVDGNTGYFAKLEGKEGILIVFDIGADMVVSSIVEITKGLGTDYTKQVIRDK